MPTRPSRAARFAAVAAVLAAAHTAGDFLVQTDRQASLKPCRADRDAECTEAQSWAALVGHVASYHAVQATALIIANHVLDLRLHPGRTALGIGASALSHGVIDRRWPVRQWMLRTGSGPYYHRGGAMHVDQAMHQAALAVSAAIITGGPCD
ncbi:hypothetical protein [Nocardiopsis synnemataformans]|uniref:hypothetical protein n=1 Tax=Nocardiopsis synnemataformans TaxID=61305 RepID=UPI003EBBB443